MLHKPTAFGGRNETGNATRIVSLPLVDERQPATCPAAARCYNPPERKRLNPGSPPSESTDPEDHCEHTASYLWPILKNESVYQYQVNPPALSGYPG